MNTEQDHASVSAVSSTSSDRQQRRSDVRKNSVGTELGLQAGLTFSKVPRKILRRFNNLGKSKERRHLRKNLRKIFRNALALT